VASEVPAYELLVEEKHWHALQRLPHESQRKNALGFLTDYVVYTPTKRLPNGSLRQLKGTQRGLWQFDIDRQYRIIYRVDETRKQVLIDYIGPHPDWGIRRGQRIRN
jgi:Txe/YoeB family toxin of Txe-Axe toxin-antitoxin module